MLHIIFVSLCTDLVSSIILSGAYLVSYIILGRNPKFGVWVHLEVVECRIPFWITVTLTF